MTQYVRRLYISKEILFYQYLIGQGRSKLQSINGWRQSLVPMGTMGATVQWYHTSQSIHGPHKILLVAVISNSYFLLFFDQI